MITYKLEATLASGSTGDDLASLLETAAEQIRARMTSALEPSSLSMEGANEHGKVRIVHGVQSVERPPVRVGDLPDRDDG